MLYRNNMPDESPPLIPLHWRSRQDLVSDISTKR